MIASLTGWFKNCNAIALRQHPKRRRLIIQAKSAGNYQLFQLAFSDGHAKLARALLENGAPMETAAIGRRKAVTLGSIPWPCCNSQDATRIWEQ